MPLWILKMKKILNSKNNLLVKVFYCLIVILFISIPTKSYAEVVDTQINGGVIEASTEFLRDLDYETWQLVAYKSPDRNQSINARSLSESTFKTIFGRGILRASSTSFSS